VANTGDPDENVIVIDRIDDPVLAHADAMLIGWTLELL
jgi:hypothetical protein